MLDRELIRKVIAIKLERGYTLLDLSRIFDLSGNSSALGSAPTRDKNSSFPNAFIGNPEKI